MKPATQRDSGMRAIMIVGNAVKTISINPDDQLNSLYEHIGCDLVTGGGYPDDRHAAWVDDCGLISGDPIIPLTQTTWYPEPLAGVIVITGFDPDTGENTPATLTADEVKAMIESTSILLKETH